MVLRPIELEQGFEEEDVPSCSSASRACMRAPLFQLASTTTVAAAYPDMTAFRMGKLVLVGGASAKN